MRTVEASTIDGKLVSVIKTKEQFCVKIENLEESEIDSEGHVIKSERKVCDDSRNATDIESKGENITFDVWNVNNEEQVTPKNIFPFVKDSNKLGTIKIEEAFCEEKETKPKDEYFVEMKDKKFILTEEIEIKTDENDFDRSEEDSVMTESKVSTRLRRKRERLKTNHEIKLSKSCIKRTSTKKDVTEITIHQRESISFKAKNKTCRLRTCEVPSEITLYKCDSCPFNAEKKNNIKRHMLKHSKLKFNCDMCSFNTKYKRGLKRHLLTHDKSSAVTYKCYSCLFQTRCKYHLKSHMWKHKDPSERKLHKCNCCPYQTWSERNLRDHLLRHSKAIFNCDFCSYHSAYKSNLKSHLRVHKASSEVTMYKCDSCPFQSKWKRTCDRHMLKHKDPSEVTIFQCDSCPYQSRIKQNFRNHMLRHKTPEETC